MPILPAVRRCTGAGYAGEAAGASPLRGTPSSAHRAIARREDHGGAGGGPVGAATTKEVAMTTFQPSTGTRLARRIAIASVVPFLVVLAGCGTSIPPFPRGS